MPILGSSFIFNGLQLFLTSRLLFDTVKISVFRALKPFSTYLRILGTIHVLISYYNLKLFHASDRVSGVSDATGISMFWALTTKRTHGPGSLVLLLFRFLFRYPNLIFVVRVSLEYKICFFRVGRAWHGHHERCGDGANRGAFIFTYTSEVPLLEL
jgi:hypothetical protein